MTSDDLLRLAGLKPEMLEAARDAARRQGVPVDVWLRSVVRSAAGEPAHAAAKSPKRPRRARAPARESEAEQSMRAISERLDALSEKIADVSHGSAPRAREPAGDSLSDTLRAIEERIESRGPTSPPTSPAGYATPPRRSRERDEWPRTEPEAPFHAAPEDDDDIERQIAEIAARQQALDDQGDPLRDQFLALSRRLDEAPRGKAGDLRDQMAELTEELQAIRGGGFESAVNTLRRELADINRKLSEAAPREAVQAIEAQVRALSTRIDEGRHAGGDPQALANIETGLAEIYEALRHMAPAEQLAAFREEIRRLDDKIENLASREPDSNTTTAILRQLERAIIDLGTIASRAASGDALVALAEEVQEISARTDRILADAGTRESAFSSMIEQRFADLARHLDSRQQSSIATAQTQINSVVSALAEKLERADIGDNSSTLNAIAGQLDQITQRLEHSDARIGQFGQLEQSFADLVGRMDAIHASAVSAAQEAVRHAPSHNDLAALRRDLGALQENHQQSDLRTQETLSSVHHTLAKLVDRLELGTTPPAETRAYAPPPAAERPLRRPAPDDAPRRAAEPPPPAPPAAFEPAVRAEAPAPLAPRPPIDPTLPADFPLEPGTAPMRGMTDVAAERPALPADENSKSNFIAAARRAAQAAMRSTEPAPATEGQGSSFAALARKLRGRKSVMLAVLLVASIGALYVAFDKPPAEPLSGVKKVTTAAIKPPEPRAATTATIPAAPARTVTASATPAATPREAPAAPPAAAPASSEMPAVSPLTIASIQLPAASEHTAAVSRATGLGSTPSAHGGPSELPSSFPSALRSAAMSGDAAAEYEIGVRFAEGRGTAQNHAEAALWLERAANRNLAPAQYRLGSLYEKGNGVKKDVVQARRLYRAAADAGNGKAMHNLAVLYAEGIEGRPDYANALEWFRKAANHGIADSQYNVAILYARGLGAEVNYAESYKWFALAAQQGDEDAGKKRDDVGARLDGEQLQAAQRAVQNFRPLQQPESAVTVLAPAGGWESAAPHGAGKPPKAGFGRKRTQT